MRPTWSSPSENNLPYADPSTSLRIYTESLRDRDRSHHGKAFDDLLNGSLGRRARHTPS